MGYSRNLIAYFSDDEHDGTETGVCDITTTLNGEAPPFNSLVIEPKILAEEHVAVGAVIDVGWGEECDQLVKAKTVGGPLGLSILELVRDAPPVPPNTPLKVKIVSAAVPTLFHTATLDFKLVIAGTDVEI